jgi:hypothetical protein
MQIACIEFGCDVLKPDKAHFDRVRRKHAAPVIALLDAQKKISKKGGTMRSQAQSCANWPSARRPSNSTARLSSTNGTRHRYEFNNALPREARKARASFMARPRRQTRRGRSSLKEHPFFPACQFHPEFQQAEQAAPASSAASSPPATLPASPADLIRRASHERSACRPTTGGGTHLRFVLIGGFAVNAHGHSRVTGDLDLAVPKPERDAWVELVWE